MMQHRQISSHRYHYARRSKVIYSCSFQSRQRSTINYGQFKNNNNNNNNNNRKHHYEIVVLCRGVNNNNNNNNNSNNNNNNDSNNIMFDDLQLIVGDATLLWILELISRVCQVSVSPDFPGWLAPIDMPTTTSIASMISTTLWQFTWIGFSALQGTYNMRSFDEEKQNEKKTLEQTFITFLLYAPAQVFGDAFSLEAHLMNVAATPPLLVRLPLTFACMFAFRFYICVIYRGEFNRELKESEYKLLYGTLTCALFITLCGAITQTMHPEIHAEFSKELFEMIRR